MKRRWVFLVSIVACAGIAAWLLPMFIYLPITVSEGYESFGPPMNHPLSEVVKDDRPRFHLDPDKPWQIEFGRGSGWHGLDTAKLDQSGNLVLYQLKQQGWETTSAQLPPDSVEKVLKAVEENRILELSKMYHANIADGTQWVLWVRQGNREKPIYFNNHFPSPIIQFADQFDQIISESVGPTLRWLAVPCAWSRDHERQLWDSIKRKTPGCLAFAGERF